MLQWLPAKLNIEFKPGEFTMYDDAGLEDFVINRIKELFALGGMTAYRFSMITGIPRTTVSDYLNGHIHPSLYFVGVCCSCLGISQEEFYKSYDAGRVYHPMLDLVATDTADISIKQVCTMRMLEKISKQLDALTEEINILN